MEVSVARRQGNPAMRPCRQCRSPIENQVAVCPQCETVQDEKAKPTPPTPVLRRRLFRRAPAAPAPVNPGAPTRRRPGFVVSLFADIVGLFLDPRGFLFLVGLLVLGALVGGLLAGASGAAAGVAGAVIAIVLCFGLLRLLSSSEG
jgi:hypothetical protein